MNTREEILNMSPEEMMDEAIKYAESNKTD